MTPMSNKKRPTNCPREAPIKRPGKKSPAGKAIPYSMAQKKNQSRKNTTATYTLNPAPSEKEVRKNLTVFPSEVKSKEARGF
jgi:hypothetical protein